ncbi:MAG: hypothetical protein M1825_001096 [Sarcosagium campestre]|nr:MAG: hypothetical protein M1825_001096 [Sarcosagium campestre]
MDRHLLHARRLAGQHPNDPPILNYGGPILLRATPRSGIRRSPYLTPQPDQPSRSTVTMLGSGGGAPQNFSRPTNIRSNTTDHEFPPPRDQSMANYHSQTPQHAQGFFEPSLPTASYANQTAMPSLTASQMAAQAAMQHQITQQHTRKRSQTVPTPQSPQEPSTGRRKLKSPPPGIHTGSMQNGRSSPADLQFRDGFPGGPATAAATAANAVYPRSALSSPSLPPPLDNAPPLPNQEPKQKAEKSKMKLFSKPKNIHISKDKDVDKKAGGLPSPIKGGVYGAGPLHRMANASTTSLADSTMTMPPSTFYASANNSTSTLVPSSDKTSGAEKHKHHFLSRPKHRHKDKEDHKPLPLSSASSNSKPLDPHAPQSLYSFAPSSPGPTTATFSKSMSGFDLRHGGRALREKKKEEKASAGGAGYRDDDTAFPNGEWGMFAGQAAGGGVGASGAGTAGGLSAFGTPGSGYIDSFGQPTLQGYGLVGMTPDDAWPFLKAKLLVVFEGEDLRLPVEDLNKLVVVHIQRCVQKRAPLTILEDFRDLLETGFGSLEQTLRSTPDEQLVPRLVDLWLAVFGTVLPFMEAVFLPLELEFRGVGTILNAREAKDFWGAAPLGESDSPLANALDVRRIALICYRDAIIIPRHDTLKVRFSRLSLESINGVSNTPDSSPDETYGGRPGTAASLDPGLASFNSQGSTLLNDSSASAGARSRATSNTSSAFGNASVSSASDALSSSSPRVRQGNAKAIPRPANATDSSRVTETVARMLQCVSVLASLQSADDAQAKMEDLAKTLKHNWLGRGRTGRNRRGFVGTKMTGPRPGAGSPTPTPSTVEDVGQAKSSL